MAMKEKSGVVKQATTSRTATAGKTATGRIILTPTKPSTLGRERIRKAVVQAYGKKTA